MLRAIRKSLGLKLFLSYLLVILVGMLVLSVVTDLVIPAAYSRHMANMGIAMPGMMGGGSMMQEFYQNFQAGVIEALAWASLAATLAALVVSWFTSRRIVTPLRRMMLTSQRITEGHYEERVPVPGNPNPDDQDELAQLAQRFNQMAARLNEIETMRRELIGDVSHELRTPLTVIKGTMEGLMDGVLPAENATFQQIEQEADRLQRLVADLQELSRVESGAIPLDFQPVPVDQLVTAVVKRLGPLFEAKEVRLETHLAKELPLVLGDIDRLTQVFINIAGNALKYTPGGGRVDISARGQGSEVEFTIRDTGIGLAAEDLPHVFTRFYRVDKSRSRASGGSGIGLAIAKHLVEAHAGRIWASSEGPGNGSVFGFTIPAATR